MQYQYLTLEREYGSGAGEIGRQLGQLLGIPCYNQEITAQGGANLGVDPQLTTAYEEKAAGSFLYSLYLLGKMTGGESDLASRESKVHQAQQQAVRQLALQGPCILVGHCAGEALRDMGGVLRVFVHADMPWRLQRAVQQYGLPADDAARTLRNTDRQRAAYYKACAGTAWQDPDQYDLVLNSSRLGLGRCVRILRRLMQEG